MMNRRSFVAAFSSGLLGSAGIFPMLTTAQASTGASLLEAAERLAAEPFRLPNTTLPPPFADLTYDAFRGIRPRAGDAAFLPQGDKFAVDLLPPGLYFPGRVIIEKVVAGRVETVRFSPQLFDFEPRYFDAVPDEAPGAGFTGIRLRHPINRADHFDEVAVFQGGSYFRAIGRAMAYGLSARAVALGTGGPQPEEFPRFTRFRLHEGDGSRIRLEAVVDSPSLTAHFDTILVPGDDTLMDVTVTVFPRAELTTIGIASLTSMYLKGPMHAAVSDDFRPRVHDTDVLVVHNGAGETLWRPIANPARVESSAFSDEDPRSFGLFQTARHYDDFEDTEARYHHRPSAIVTPKSNWGAGAVVLVEIPTADEFLDNIVAFWRPQEPLRSGRAYRFDYALRWTLQEPEMGRLARILQSRSGEEHDQPGVRRFVVDFDTEPGDLVMDLSADTEDPESVFGKSLFALPDGRGTRATFLLKPDAADTVELRLSLRDHAGVDQSPVWLHRWTRKRDGGA